MYCVNGESGSSLLHSVHSHVLCIHSVHSYVLYIHSVHSYVLHHMTENMRGYEIVPIFTLHVRPTAKIFLSKMWSNVVVLFVIIIIFIISILIYLTHCPTTIIIITLRWECSAYSSTIACFY